MPLGSFPQTITVKVGYRDMVRGLRDLALGPQSIVVVHSSLSSFGYVAGGAETVVGALSATGGTIVMPAFTYQTMITPETGPALNGLTYGVAADNVASEFWRPDLPIHKDIGLIPETLRQQPAAKRSAHPVLSFVAIGKYAEELLATQTYEDPLAPLSWVADRGGEILMLGTTHATNTMIHVGEQRGGRKYFVRWALVNDSIATVSWPGDSSGFGALAPHLKQHLRRTQIGTASVQCIPADQLVKIAADLIQQDPAALLCNAPDCERCRDHRKALERL